MMDMITGMVSQNANISKEQSIKAIEAVLAYISHEMPDDIGKTVITKIINSNGVSGGGFDWETILNTYTAKFGSIMERSEI